MTPTKTALRLMGRGFDPEFVVAYMEEELRRDPFAFHTETQLAAARIAAQWRAVKRAYGIIGKAALDAFTSMKRSFDDPQYTKGA